ncbi:MAG: glutathione peroxidase, partial [Myxococcota bacterium]
AGLEKLYQDSKAQGVVVLGFPCNQFGAQEPGSSSDIAQFCEKNYGVSFPMFEKIDVNGEGTHALYRELKAETDGADIQWNFEKFLLDKSGNVVGRYPSNAAPEKLAAEIANLL